MYTFYASYDLYTLHTSFTPFTLFNAGFISLSLRFRQAQMRMEFKLNSVQQDFIVLIYLIKLFSFQKSSETTMAKNTLWETHLKTWIFTVIID